MWCEAETSGLMGKATTRVFMEVTKGCLARKFLLSPVGLSLTEEFWVTAQDMPQSCPCQGAKKLGHAATIHCLGSTAGGWMLAPHYLSYVHRVLRAIESLQGKAGLAHGSCQRTLQRNGTP